MKACNIILKQNAQDSFDLEVLRGESKFIVETWKQGSESILSTTVFKELQQHKLTPAENVTDLLHFALGLYTADQVVSREIHGFQGWSRHFKLYVPVSKLVEWTAIRQYMQELLSFLSGDNWEIILREKTPAASKQGAIQTNVKSDQNTKKITDVALFSGGMDSFINAINLLEKKNKVAFVSHYKRGVEGKVQSTLYTKLNKQYGENSFISHQFYVQPNQNFKGATKEGSSRARSFLFLCLGLTVTNTLGENVNFIIPENGLISLNIPLTGTRLSSHSTRTTHPYYINLFRKVAQGLGIKNKITNPYQFMTKGEMILDCKNIAIFKKMNPETVSCSHSEHSRYAGLSPGIQCGYCVPCIIRRAAEKKGKVSGTKYVHDILKEIPSATTQSGSDIRAFKLALKRMENKKDLSLMFDILGAGPLSFESAELQNYIATYKRGMNEVQALLE
jgi:7-cyano-7-deazaguanine synthase in queuosine biosynthesis